MFAIPVHMFSVYGEGQVAHEDRKLLNFFALGQPSFICLKEPDTRKCRAAIIFIIADIARLLPVTGSNQPLITNSFEMTSLDRLYVYIIFTSLFNKILTENVFSVHS